MKTSKRAMQMPILWSNLQVWISALFWRTRMPWSEIGFIGRGRKYLEREISVNAENVQSAVERQRWSGNNLDERVWWDTESYNPNGSDIEYRINEAGDIIPISNFRD